MINKLIKLYNKFKMFIKFIINEINSLYSKDNNLHDDYDIDYYLEVLN